MKTSILLLVALLGFSFTSASGADLKFPKKGKTLFTVSIPDDWNPKFDEEGTLEAEDEDENAYIAIWEEDTDTELAKVAEDIDEILAEYAKDVKLAGKPEQYNKLGGIPGLLFKGTAKDKEDGSGIGFEAIILAIDKDSAAVIYFDYGQDAPEGVVKKLIKILESVTPAK